MEIWKEIKRTQLVTAQSLHDKMTADSNINTTNLSEILPFMKNYRKTDTTVILLSINPTFQAKKLGRFLQ